jgi:hypothetical protein
MCGTPRRNVATLECRRTNGGAQQHPPCVKWVRTVSHWGTRHVPVGYAPCPTGVRTVSQWGTYRVPVGYAPCPSGVRTVSQWGTDRVPLGYAPCPSGVRTVSQRAPTVDTNTPGTPTSSFDPLTNGKLSIILPNHRTLVRKDEDSGGCRRYGMVLDSTRLDLYRRGS